MVRRVSVACLLALVLLVSATAPGLARHTDPPQNHDEPTAQDTAMRLWLHCCDERTFDGEETSGGNADEIASATQTEGSTTYTFSEADEGMEYAFARDHGPVDVDASLRFEWAGGWDLEVLLKTTETGTTLADQTGDLQAADTPSGIQQDTRTFSFTDVTLPEGENLEIEVRASAKQDPVPQGATVSLIADHEDSRLDLQGDLLSKQLWTHTPADNPRSEFNLDAPESERQIQATYVLTSAFGADGLSLSDGTIRARDEDGDLVDMTPGTSGDQVITISHTEGSGPEQVWKMTRSWNYSEEREPGRYTMEARLRSNQDDQLSDTTSLILGAGIDISVRGLSTREVRPEENATYRVVVSNRAARDVEVKLRLDGADPWDAVLSSPTIVVPDDGERLVDLKVTPDATAQDGDERTVSIEADPQNEPRIDPVSTNVTTRAVDETRLEQVVEVIEEPEGEIAPGGNRSFTVAIFNNGTVRDELFLTRAQVPDGWTASFDEESFALDPGERRQVEVTVHAAQDAEVDSEHEIVVEVQSATDADAAEQASVTMVVGVFVDYDITVLDRIRTVPMDSDGAIWRFEVTSRSNVQIQVVALLPGGETFRGDNDMTIDPGETAESYAFYSFSACDDPPALSIHPSREDAPVKSVDLVACGQEGFTARELMVEPRADFDEISGVFTTRSRATAEPGESVTFPVRVSNVGTESYDSVAIDASRAPPEWNVSFIGWDDPAIESYSNSGPSDADCGWFCGSATVNVSVPENASAGKHEITVTATSKTAQPATGSFTYVVEVAPERDVTVRAVEDSLAVQPGGDALFNVVVDNQGNVRETIDTSVDAGQLPGEWTMRPLASTVEVPPSSKRVVTTVLSPPESASAGETGSVDVTAATGFGTTDEFELTATVVEAADVELSAPFTGGSVEPGTAIPYDVQVTNQGTAIRNISLSTSEVPEGFNVTLRQDDENVSSVSVDPGATANVTLRIHVPEDAAGLVGTVLEASPAGETGSATLALNATIRAVQDVRLQVQPRHRVVPGGQPAEYVVTVFNRGTANDTFFVCVPDLTGSCHQTLSQGPWTESVSQPRVAVQAKDSRSVLLTVVPEEDATPGATRRTPITARSVDDPSVSSTRTVETEVLKRDVGFASTGDAVGAAPGQTVTAAPIVENRGNDGDVFAIEIVSAPDGWSVDATPEVRIQAGGSSPARIQVTPPPDAEKGVYGLQVRTFSKLDPTVEAETTTLIRVSDFRSRDVDDDGQPEYAVDSNDDPADGFESFAEISDAGIRTLVIKSGSFGDTVRTGYVLRTQENPVTKYRFWGPDGGVLTNVTAARILWQDSLGYLADVDGDGRVDFMYDEATDEIVRAVSVQGRDAYLVDGDGDGTMDTYYNHDRRITTTTGDHPGEDVAVDDDGDGSYDLVVNSATGESHAYTPVDAVARGFLLYGWLFLLGIAAIVLADVVFLVRVKGGSP